MNCRVVSVNPSQFPYKPPAYLVRGLYHLDPLLRLRWSESEQKWCLEKKLLARVEYIKSLPHFKKRRGVYVENESWIRAREGHILIGHYDPQPQLGEWVLRNLQMYDMRRIGGWKEAELQILRAEEKLAESKERAAKGERWDMAVDFWESEQWRQGNRAAVPKKYEEIAGE